MLVRPVSGSGAAPGGDAELVPRRIGQHDPALVACLAHVGVPGAEAEQAADLVVLLPVGGVDVEVKPVLAGLALGHAREGQRRRHRPRADPALRHQRGANSDNPVLFVLHLAEPRTEHQNRARPPGSAQSIASSVNLLAMSGPPGHVAGPPTATR